MGSGFPILASAPGSPIATGLSPHGVVVADFNRDGALDLAVVNTNCSVLPCGPGTISILLGKGDGTFSVSSIQVSGTAPVAIAVGDFNGDGIPDLAVANSGSNNLTILLGRGDGNFTATPASPATGTTPVAMAVGDFNGDGKLDLAVANSAGSNITILFGDGAGNFPTAATSPVNNPTSIAAADFNGDQKLDLAVTSGPPFNTVTVLLGNGDGTFQTQAPIPAGTNPLAVITADFNQDGKPDLAVANSGSNSLSILISNGDGTFSPATSQPATGSAPDAIAVGDFNSDGKQDLAVANSGDSTVTILLGDGTGNFSANSYSAGTGAAPAAVALGDFNLDGSLDLALADFGTNGATVLLQAAVASLAPGALQFGNQAVSSTSAAQPVTLSNLGSAPLKISNITTSGDFAQTNACGGGVVAGGSCTLNITFTPTAAGARTGSMTVTDNNGAIPGSTQTVAFAGTGTAPDVVLSPTGLIFGSVPLGSSSGTQSVTLTNTGNAALSITSVAASGDFSQTNDCGSSIAVAGSCVITVKFTPTAGGTRTGTITITDNAIYSFQTVTLSGSGGDYALSISPTSMSIGAGQSAAFTLSVTSVGGFNQAVNLTCSGAPAASVCLLASPTVTPTANGTATSTVTLSTTAHGLVPGKPRLPMNLLPAGSLRYSVPALLCLLVISAAWAVGKTRLGRRACLAFALLLLIAGAWTACGGAAKSNPGTPTGSYVLTVSGASGGAVQLNHTQTFVVTVQ